MVGTKQYGHFLFKQVQSGDSVQDPDTGEWTPAPPAWVFHSVCREETNGRGNIIQGADGEALVFSSLVLLPKGTARIPEGTLIRVTEVKDPEGQKRIQGAVLKCDIGNLHGRIWV
ncbi:MAG: DUF6093 family protein [Syntrophothermus sp.]